MLNARKIDMDNAGLPFLIGIQQTPYSENFLNIIKTSPYHGHT